MKHQVRITVEARPTAAITPSMIRRSAGSDEPAVETGPTGTMRARRINVLR